MGPIVCCDGAGGVCGTSDGAILMHFSRDKKCFIAYEQSCGCKTALNIYSFSRIFIQHNTGEHHRRLE
jgi:hypothetical protein